MPKFQVGKIVYVLKTHLLFGKVIDEDYDLDDYEPGLQVQADPHPWEDDEREIYRLFER